MSIRTVGMALTFAGASVAVAQGPPVLPQPKPLPGTITPSETTKLKDELDALKKERERLVPGEDPAEAKRRADRVQLRIQLLDVLKQIQNAPARTPMAVEPKKSPEPKPKPVNSEAVTPVVDPLRAALNFYRDNKVEDAYQLFNRIDLESLTREDKAFVKYMTACCLRQKGKFDEAMTLYREVADEKDDAFLAENAVWQIGVIKSTRELDSQLEQLRPGKKNVPK